MKVAVVGSIRTNNFQDEQLVQKITNLWKEASERLTNAEKSTYGVYHEYESNYKGDYSLSIAAEESNGESFLEIPSNEKYKVFKVDPAKENSVFHTWQEIWAQEEAGTLKRSYTYDFEKYEPNGEISIYIAVK